MPTLSVLITRFGDPFQLIADSASLLAHGFDALAVALLGVVGADFLRRRVGALLLGAGDRPIRRTRACAVVVNVTRPRARRLEET